MRPVRLTLTIAIALLIAAPLPAAQQEPVLSVAEGSRARASPLRCSAPSSRRASSSSIPSSRLTSMTTTSTSRRSSARSAMWTIAAATAPRKALGARSPTASAIGWRSNSKSPASQRRSTKPRTTRRRCRHGSRSPGSAMSKGRCGGAGTARRRRGRKCSATPSSSSRTHKDKLLIGTAGVEIKFGTGIVRGFSWGTIIARAAVEYAAGSSSQFDSGEYAVEFVKRLGPRFRIYAGIEGTQDEVSAIGELQWHVTPHVDRQGQQRHRADLESH